MSWVALHFKFDFKLHYKTVDKRNDISSSSNIDNAETNLKSKKQKQQGKMSVLNKLLKFLSHKMEHLCCPSRIDDMGLFFFQK